MISAYKVKEKSFVRKRWQNSNRIHLNRSTCTCTGQILSDLKSKIWDNGICPRFQWLACIFSDFQPKIKWLVSKYTVINTCVFSNLLSLCWREKKPLWKRNDDNILSNIFQQLTCPDRSKGVKTAGTSPSSQKSSGI